MEIGEFYEEGWSAYWKRSGFGELGIVPPGRGMPRLAFAGGRAVKEIVMARFVYNRYRLRPSKGVHSADSLFVIVKPCYRIPWIRRSTSSTT